MQEQSEQTFSAQIWWAEQMSACIAIQSCLGNAQLPLAFSGNGHWVQSE
jgi:hypothetical protein